MTELTSHLRDLAEPMPAWLRDYQPGQPFPRGAFFQSRLTYYPGSGRDGHAVRVFGGSRSCHCFVQVDYGVSLAELKEELQHPQHGFRGYDSLDQLELGEREVLPQGWTPHLDPTEVGPSVNRFVGIVPYALLQILQRQSGYGDEHGPERLAVLFLGADGIASYDALFCQETSLGAPFVALLQDHGFGGNYDRFGAGGALERIVLRTGVFPEYLFVADEGTRAWQGYEPVPEIDADKGGQWNNARRLYRRTSQR